MHLKKERILVAMSGGVDSSLAAALLVEEGHDVVGVTMKTFCYEETPGPTRTCCGLDGIMDARRVADHLGIPHHVFDVEEDFTRDVIDDFVREYADGRTPNPCVRCNSFTKFRDLMKRGRMLGCDAIASGHYARIVPAGHGLTSGTPASPDGIPHHRTGPGTAGSDLPELRRGHDSAKDQTYFLWGLPPEILPQLRFPVGELGKDEVRRRSRELQLATAEKPESQDICFVPAGDYREFLASRLQPNHRALEPGPIVTRDGQVVGEHSGYAGFTVGQRKGLSGGLPEAHYVLEVRPETREVVIGPREQLYSQGAEVNDLNWLAPEAPTEGAAVNVQIRHQARPIPARVLPSGDALRISFRDPQMAVTPGQSAAVYQGERLLGGGRIVRGLPAEEVEHAA